MREKRRACRVLVRKPEGMQPIGGWKRRGEDNIKTVLKEIG
jgi:hypothetical protein